MSDERKSSIRRIIGRGGGEGCLHPVVSYMVTTVSAEPGASTFSRYC